jgi:hypothetical protein
MSVNLLIGNDLERSGRRLIEVVSLNLDGGTKEYHKLSLRTAGVTAKIRTEHLPKKSRERCRYSSLLSCCLIQDCAIT